MNCPNPNCKTPMKKVLCTRNDTYYWICPTCPGVRIKDPN